jgi:hypothetical protein
MEGREIVKEALGRFVPGREIIHRHLTLLPLTATPAWGGATPCYRTLDEALASGTARVTEVSEGGSVPELKFVNDGDLPVLVLDGEELIGAKQNRTVNVSVLVPAHTTLGLPVTCVEAGRWHHTSAAFATAPRSHFATGRARKAAQVTESLRRGGGHGADQGDVWRVIDAKAQRMAAASPTHAMAAMYEQHSDGIEAFVEAMNRPSPDQVGALFLLNGRVVGFDAFDHPKTLAALLPKLIRSNALDALDAPGVSPVTPPVSPAEAGMAFLRSVAESAAERFPALGMGEEFRLSAAGMHGSALVAEGQTVHLCAFPAPIGQDQSTTAAMTAPLARASARARGHA